MITLIAAFAMMSRPAAVRSRAMEVLYRREIVAAGDRHIVEMRAGGMAMV